MGVPNSVAAKVGEVSDDSDDTQAAGLLAGEAQPKQCFDAAIGVDVLTVLRGNADLVTGSNRPGLVKWARPAPARARPEKRAIRLLVRDIPLLS